MSKWENLSFRENLIAAAEGGNDISLVRHGNAAVTRRTWMAKLPRVVDDLARLWSLDVGRPFQPGGQASWVARARRRSGDQVVLKIGWRHDEAIHELDGLQVWNGDGVVLLLDAWTSDDTTALLLESCEPGSALKKTLPPLEQDVIVTGLLRRLWIDPPTSHPFRPLQAMCDWWSDEYEEKYAAQRRGPRLEQGLSNAGIELFRNLPGTAERSVLLFTDLHPDNVLAAGREPWLAIDPKPYVGDPTYDPLQHMLNFPDRLVADPVGFALRIARLLDLDSGRLRQWLFARCVQESVDHPHLLSVITDIAAPEHPAGRMGRRYT
jgi:streptomycin 6-kinase